MDAELIKACLNFGMAGLLVFIGWRIVDKWAGKFLAAQVKQAESMGKLATAVEGGQGEQRDIVLALRVVATQQAELKDWMRELDEHVRNGEGRQG